MSAGRVGGIEVPKQTIIDHHGDFRSVPRGSYRASAPPRRYHPWPRRDGAETRLRAATGSTGDSRPRRRRRRSRPAPAWSPCAALAAESEDLEAPLGSRAMQSPVLSAEFELADVYGSHSPPPSRITGCTAIASQPAAALTAGHLPADPHAAVAKLDDLGASGVVDPFRQAAGRPESNVPIDCTGHGGRPVRLARGGGRIAVSRRATPPPCRRRCR